MGEKENASVGKEEERKLEALRIINYQSHVDTSITFGRITGIRGESMNGKTAIIRALRWLLRNRPLGFRFNTRSDQEGKTTVKVKVDGIDISATKTDKEHVYKISGHGERRKISRDVPQEVTDIFNLEEEVNFQYQLDSPFLIIGRPGEIAKAIAKAARTEQIDVAIKRITQKTNKLLATKKVIDSDIEDLRQSLSQISRIEEDVGPMVRRLGRINKKIDRAEGKVYKIEQLTRRINKINERLRLAEKSKEIKEQIKAYEHIQSNIADIEHKVELVSRCIWLDEKIKRNEGDKKKIADEYMHQLKTLRLCPTCLAEINEDKIRSIENEVYSFKRHPRQRQDSYRSNR